MPPRDRMLPNAYPLLAQTLSTQISSNEDHLRYLCLNIFHNFSDIVKFLPFSGEVNPWDVEYAIRMQEEENRRLNYAYRWFWTKGIIDGEVTNCLIDNLYYRSPSLPRYSLSLDDDIDYDEETDYEENDNPPTAYLYVKVYYGVKCTAVVTRKKFVEIRIPNGLSMETEALKAAADAAIANQIRSMNAHLVTTSFASQVEEIPESETISSFVVHNDDYNNITDNDDCPLCRQDIEGFLPTIIESGAAARQL